MIRSSCFRIHSLWQGRKENVASAAARLRVFLDLSKAPPDRSWHCTVQPNGYCDLQAHPDCIEQHIESLMKESEDRGSLPGSGFLGDLSAMCKDQVPRADDPHISWNLGNPRTNCFKLYSDNQGITDPRFVTYDIMRTNVLSVGMAFDPEWCEASPMGLLPYLDREPYNRPAIGPAWMVWLSPAYAKLVTPPPRWRGIITEWLSDGSLFMATGTDTFNIKRSDHLYRARVIHRQIDPLNYTVPFNGRCGRSDRVPPFPKV